MLPIVQVSLSFFCSKMEHCFNFLWLKMLFENVFPELKNDSRLYNVFLKGPERTLFTVLHTVKGRQWYFLCLPSLCCFLRGPRRLEVHSMRLRLQGTQYVPIIAPFQGELGPLFWYSYPRQTGHPQFPLPKLTSKLPPIYTHPTLHPTKNSLRFRPPWAPPRHPAPIQTQVPLGPPTLTSLHTPLPPPDFWVPHLYPWCSPTCIPSSPTPEWSLPHPWAPSYLALLL